MAISWLSASRSAAGHSVRCSVKPRSPNFVSSQHGGPRASARRTLSSSAQTPKSPGRWRMLEGALIGVGLTLALSEYGPLSAKTSKHDQLPRSQAQNQYASKQDIQQAIAELRKVLPEESLVVTDLDTLKLYGHSDNSYHPTSPHSVIVRPRGTDDVVHIVNVARKYRVPIVPYSGATSLEGHFSGVRSVLRRSQSRGTEHRCNLVPHW